MSPRVGQGYNSLGFEASSECNNFTIFFFFKFSLGLTFLYNSGFGILPVEYSSVFIPFAIRTKILVVSYSDLKWLSSLFMKRSLYVNMNSIILLLAKIDPFNVNRTEILVNVVYSWNEVYGFCSVYSLLFLHLTCTTKICSFLLKIDGVSVFYITGHW